MYEQGSAVVFDTAMRKRISNALFQLLELAVELLGRRVRVDVDEGPYFFIPVEAQECLQFALG
jgi:hypothetical protein